MTQELETDGTFTADPTVGTESPSVRQCSRDQQKTPSIISTDPRGRIGELEAICGRLQSVSLIRSSIIRTTCLSDVLPYYICDTSVNYPEYNYYQEGAPTNQSFGTCYEPNLYALSYSETKVQTHELRISGDLSHICALQSERL